MSNVSWVVIALLACVAALAVLAFVRVMRLSARPSGIDCGYRRRGDTTFTAGVLVYGTTQLHWHRFVSLRARPTHSWRRSELQIRDHEWYGASPGRMVVLYCDADDARFDLNLSGNATQGLVGWLESSPPTRTNFV